MIPDPATGVRVWLVTAMICDVASSLALRVQEVPKQASASRSSVLLQG